MNSFVIANVTGLFLFFMSDVLLWVRLRLTLKGADSAAQNKFCDIPLTTCPLRAKLTLLAENAGKGLYTKNKDVLMVPEFCVPGQLLFVEGRDSQVSVLLTRIQLDCQ